MKKTEKTVLTIAGSDPSGGAGLQADLKTFSAFGIYGMTAVTALTVGNTCGVTEILKMKPDFVARQIEAVQKDIPAAAIKTGLLANRSIIKRVAKELSAYDTSLVVDPVIATKRGDILLSEEGIQAYRSYILPIAQVITPNIVEAEQLARTSIPSYKAMYSAAEKLMQFGCASVIVKGGHFEEWQHSNDLYYDGENMVWLKSERWHTKHTHGAGDAFSAAIAASIAQGQSHKDAAEEAKRYVSRAIKEAPGLGTGEGPIAF